MSRPGPHPEPPADLNQREPLVLEWTALLFRTHDTRFPALHFGRTLQNRFDAAGSEFGVLYLAADPYCSFIETFGQETGVRFVTMSALAARNLSEVRCKRKLRLINLASSGGLARVGADGRLCAGGTPSRSAGRGLCGVIA
jgi:hypothetical protein